MRQKQIRRLHHSGFRLRAKEPRMPEPISVVILHSRSDTVRLLIRDAHDVLLDSAENQIDNALNELGSKESIDGRL